ncbi:tRNA glutamyl-Q(34) synthetase GluQRS [Pseudomaricurvus albidus]|uniref:tRNA glutamyl-Q(34) synthetase GluQRS n=1 Tax=Pseudomaricurvus albidus TaxID=2842452 RepID=UPI001F46A519|nr:tRNA glutamyl-Q(34) synthetase GluQRS [Aestuariicella albida]
MSANCTSHMPPDTSPPNNGYVGRFAPSPTGELHEGSLLTAVASYLDARRHQGQWLVRMEDLDPPREQAGAADSILRCLQAHELHWDGAVMYQSQRQAAYQEALEQLGQQGLTYPCNCTRQRLKSLPQAPAYDGHCRRHPPQRPPYAIRVQIPESPANPICFVDGFQGPQREDLAKTVGDFVILRKDGLFAYQLAVVVDDIAQGITHILRGSDLLDSSGRQRYLFERLGHQPPHMAHLPVIVNGKGQKLSKQTFAEPLKPERAADNLLLALQRLGLNPPQKRDNNCEELLQWGIEHWDPSRVPGGMVIPQ